MDKRIFKNSYVIFIISFIIFSIIFYLFNIGYTDQIKDGVIVKRFSWKYPLAISLIIWLIWYFYLFPPKKNNKQITMNDNNATTCLRYNNIQKINLNNWI